MSAVGVYVQFRTDVGPLGKLCDGSFSKAYLQWKPAFPSFDTFMSSSSAVCNPQTQ